jgi:hypothetical protein
MQNMMDVATRAILGQESAKVALDILKGGQAAPDFLFDVLTNLDPDLRRDFVRQIQKHIETTHG